MLVLIYEEMQADNLDTIQKIADFIKIDLAAEQRAKVAEKSSFVYMKANNHKFDPPAWESGYVPLIREGKMGSAKELLSPAQQA
ncbi:MAG: sulfotransferase domain-containing protein [Chloroflexota bacterium]